jgi:Tim10/DDP family zinc finger
VNYPTKLKPGVRTVPRLLCEFPNFTHFSLVKIVPFSKFYVYPSPSPHRRHGSQSLGAISAGGRYGQETSQGDDEDVLQSHRRLLRHLRHRLFLKGSLPTRSTPAHPDFSPLRLCVMMLTAAQEACIKKCTEKFMKSSERIGMRFSEENAKLMQQGVTPFNR